jgi:hypothetical protein
MRKSSRMLVMERYHMTGANLRFEWLLNSVRFLVAKDTIRAVSVSPHGKNRLEKEVSNTSDT